MKKKRINKKTSTRYLRMQKVNLLKVGEIAQSVEMKMK